MSRNLEPNNPHDGLAKLLAEMSVGAGIGAMTGGPGGAVAGAAQPPITKAMQRMASEFAQRVLGTREAARVLTTLELAQRRINDRLEGGELPRDDDFFRWHGNSRAAGEQLLEGVLLTAQREHVDKKVPYYANLYANIAFNTIIDTVTSELLLSRAASLSYTEMSLLALVARHDEFDLPKTNGRASSVDWRHASVREALDELGFAKKDFVYAEKQDNQNLQTNLGVPADLRLGDWGRLLYEALELKDLPDDELCGLADDLWAGSSDVRATP